jgi:UDP-3-O-acyl N-acetylglucosamine deacetylase
MQTTIKESFSVEGIGIHTGKYAKVVIKPAPPDTGIVFFSKDTQIPAIVENVRDTSRGVVLGVNNKRIRTCEHLLSALYGIGVDNAICEIEGEEVPALDGSSIKFVNQIKIVSQKGKKREIKIKEPIFLDSNSCCIFVVPSDEFKVSFLIDYSNLGINTQFASFTITSQLYKTEIASARTFTFASWIDELRNKGFIQGGSFENAVVIGEEGPLNSMRFQDEPVRHKILDLVGDIALLGKRLKGWVIGVRSGHTLNVKLVRRIRDGI